VIDGVTVIQEARAACEIEQPSSFFDPSSPIFDRSIPYPGRVFYAGAWRTPEQIERRREAKRRSARHAGSRAKRAECS
jgi:hypothetical protein